MVCDQLAGLSVTTTGGTLVTFTYSTGDGPDDGLAGVREPRRPRPSAPPMAAHAPVPEPTVNPH